MYYPFFFAPFFGMLAIILALWTILWKVYAVWTAVKNNHKTWFVALIILNTLGILEIIYIFNIAKKSGDDIKNDFRRALDIISK